MSMSAHPIVKHESPGSSTGPPNDDQPPHRTSSRSQGQGSTHSQDDDAAISKPLLKRRRITKACDFCHRRGRKCKIPNGSEATEPANITCLTCVEHGATCTWDRVAAKRGVKSKSTKAGGGSTTGTGPAAAAEDVSAGLASSDGVAQLRIPEAAAFVYDEKRHGDRQMIRGLIRVFFDTVYPIFPFFAETRFVEEWEATSLSSTRASFATLMAVCALSSCHVRDSAIFSLHLSLAVDANYHKTYLEDARNAIPQQTSAADCFQYLQALGTLSLAGIQLGDAALLHHTLGLYHSVAAQHNFQNETRWPADVDPVEQHVRRQFYWSMYRLEVHSALIMGHCVRCPEMQSSVAYPYMSHHLGGAITGSQDSVGGFAWGSWLHGWNYITDLYRVLEHVIVRFRSRKTMTVNRGNLYTGFDSIAPPIDIILDRVLAQRRELSPCFSSAPEPSNDIEANLCGFQVANIACTIQLLRMTSFSCNDKTFKDACRAANELIEEMSRVPVDYLRAIGSPMLQELAGVGHMLTSFIGRQLTPDDYRQLRDVIQSMAMFLENLGPSLPAAVEAGSKLSQHMGRIDDHLNQTLLQDSSILNEPEVPHATADHGHQLPINHFLVPHGSYTMIPMESLQPIPWPSQFGIPDELSWPQPSFNVFNAR